MKRWTLSRMVASCVVVAILGSCSLVLGLPKLVSWQACPGSLSPGDQRSYQAANRALLDEIAASMGVTFENVTHQPRVNSEIEDTPVVGVSTQARIRVPEVLRPELFRSELYETSFVQRLITALRSGGWQAQALATSATYAGRERPGLLVWAINATRAQPDHPYQQASMSFDPHEDTGWISVDHDADPERMEECPVEVF